VPKRPLEMGVFGRSGWGQGPFRRTSSQSVTTAFGWSRSYGPPHQIYRDLAGISKPRADRCDATAAGQPSSYYSSRRGPPIRQSGNETPVSVHV